MYACSSSPTGSPRRGGSTVLFCKEIFVTSSNHMRGKDRVWAALAWLQILTVRGLSVELWKEHWAEFGRNFFTRYN